MIYLIGVICLIIGFGIGYAVFEPKISGYRATVELQNNQLQQFMGKNEDENKVLVALSPITQTVRQMQEKIEGLEKERATQYGVLKEATSGLMSTTTALATALKSNQSRGQWGEIEMRRIVEATGMSEHVSFDVQVAIGDDRPDMVIYLPLGRTIVLDSKASMNDYLEASGISDLASEAELAYKKELLKKSMQAVKTQIDKLSAKSYWEKWESPDFVIMFVPSEAMLSTTLETEPTLLEYAFKKKVALASPVSLFSVLKTVAYTWQQQAISDNAKELGGLSLELLKRVGVLAGHSKDLAGALEKATEKYNAFAISLERNVITQANKIAEKLEQPKFDEPKKITYDSHEFTKEELVEQDGN